MGSGGERIGKGLKIEKIFNINIVRVSETRSIGHLFARVLRKKFHQRRRGDF